MQPYDVIIAGAGPGGAAVAARLHQHGLTNVLVLERYGFPREKPCGGGLTGHADEALAALDLRLEVPHVPSAEARVRFGSFERRVTLGRPVNVIRREEFDANLVDQVRRKGIEIIEGEGVEAIGDAHDAVEVTTSTGRRLQARVLVGADGAASVVRKHLLANEKALPHRLFKLEMALPAGQAEDTAMLYDFTPMARGLRGYLWVFPAPGRLINVGIMHYPSSRQSGVALTEQLRAGLDELGITLPRKGTRGWPVWGYHPGKAVSAPRIVTVGDAAGIDGLTGEGIAVAMEHAIVAGDAIARGLAHDDLSFDTYRRDLRRAVVGRELALDRWLARLIYQRGEGWRNWLALVLYDPDVLEMYAARVAGTEVLADQKLRLYKALLRHVAKRAARKRALHAAAPPIELALATP